MLHRSFKPAKCKTSLKLASSRVKLLKNKKEVQLKQLKRELAQLLESGQERTARIRVEHVVREEKTMAAYELLEIYCELIVARLPIIESQKHCPIDLKEAIASVIFASPRCSDIPELQDICKQFTAKYGKEFISAAIELRPDCGVGRMLVEKLSAKAPDGQTKIKILSAIAEEHNVKWDPQSFEENESKIHGDLLNGPNTFEMASKMRTEHPIVQTPPSYVQPFPSHDQKHNAYANFEHNAAPSSSSNFSSTDIGGGQPTVPANSHPQMNPSVTGSERTEMRHSNSGVENVFSSGRENWNMEFKDATAAAQAAAESAERASMAARAAAELSSRTEISRQNSTESQKSSHYNLRDEGPRKNTASKLSKKYAKDSGSNFQDRNPHITNAEVDKNEQDNWEVAGQRFDGDVRGSTNRSSQSASLRSSTTVYDNEFVNDLQDAERYPPNNSSEKKLGKTKMNSFHSEMSMNQFSGSNGFVTAQQSGLQYDNFDSIGEQWINKNASSVSSHTDVPSSNRQKFGTDEVEDSFVGIARGDIHRGTTTETYGSDVEFVTAQQSGLQYDNFDSFGEQRINKNADSVSSHTDVSSSNRQKFGTDAAEDLFVGIAQGNIHRGTATEGSYDNAEAVFDDYGSDDDVIMFDEPPKHEWQASKLDSSSAGRESHARLSVNSDASSPRQNFTGLEKPVSGSHVSEECHSPPVFDESSTKSARPSQPDDLLPPSYDDYESPSSESENEPSKSGVEGSSVTSVHSHEDNVFSRNSFKDRSKSRSPAGSFLESFESGYNRNQELHDSSDDNDDELVEARAEKNQGTGFSVFDKPTSRQSSSRHSTAQMSSNGITSQPLYDSGYNRDKELHNSLDDEELVEARAKNNGGTEFGVFDKVPSRQSSSRHARSQIASNDVTSQPLYDYRPPPQSSRLSLASEIDASGNSHFPESSDTLKADESFDQSSLESEQGLNFGKLSGGLRNKGYRLPPYTKTPSAVASSKKAAGNAVSSPQKDFSAPHTGKSALNSGISTNEESKTRLRTPASDDLDTDDSEEEILQQKPRSRREQYSAKERNEMNTKSSIRAPPPSTVLDSRDNDSEDDVPKQTFASTGRARGGFSRRTKATPSSGTSSYSKASSAGIEKVPSNSFTRSETALKPQSQTESSRLHWGSSTDTGAAKQATYKPTPEPNMATHKENRNSPATEPPSTAAALKTSESTGVPKQSTSTGHAPSRESSLNKASHVHPKLPDYDIIAAKFQSLRQNRQ